MPKVDISINGRFYAVSCDEGQENRLHELAGMIDQRVRIFAGPVSGIGENHLLVLAGLMLADELTESKAQAQQIGNGQSNNAALEDQDLLVAAVEHLTERIAVIADRLEQA